MTSRLTKWLLVLTLLLLPVLANATTYYVDRNLPGNDANNGTSEATPFLRVSYAVTVATSPGDTILVKNGTYPETIWMKSSGTAGNPITLKNFPGHTPLLDLGDGTNNNQRLRIKNVATPAVIAYIVIEGLEITGGWEAIKGSTAEFVTIRNNYIHDNGASDGVADPGVGILCTYCYAWTITKNVFSHNGDFNRSRGYGLYIYGTGHVITNNLIYDNANSGLQGSGYPFSSGGATAQRQAGFQALIANNTFAYNKSRAIVFDQAEHHDCIVENNIFYQNATITTVNGVRSAFGGGLGGHIIRNNHFYATAPRGTIPIDTTNASSYTQTNNKCLAQGVCTASTTDPLMVNAPATVPGSPDFSLQATSPAIGIGNGTCNGVCDAGAFETFGYGSATVNAAVLDVTLGMFANVPVRPTAAGWSVACSGGGNCGTPVVSAANVLTGADSVVRLTLTGLGGSGVCEGGQTWTVSYNAATGATTDSALIANLFKQELSTFTTQAVTNNCGTPPPPPPSGPHISYNLDENTGTNANDGTANNLDGTLTNGATWVAPGMHGTSAVHFLDGSTQHIAIPYGSGINPTTQSFTACMGVLPDAAVIGGQKIFFASDFGTNQRFYLGFIGGTWSMGIQSSGMASNPEFPVAAAYTRICLRNNAGTVTLFKNGVKGTSAQSVKVATSYTLASNLRLGYEPSASINYGGTTIDDYVDYTSALTDQQIADDFAAWEPASPPPTGTFEQKGHQWHKLRKTGGGAIDNYGALNATVSLPAGNSIILTTQTDCTGGDCSALAQRLRYNINGGAFLEVPDVIGPSGVAFYGSPAASDPDILTGVATCCLTGALTANDGATQYTDVAVPVFDLAQDASIVQRRIVRIDAAVTPGTTICFKEYNQNGNIFTTYTPSAGACLTVVAMSAGAGF